MDDYSVCSSTIKSLEEMIYDTNVTLLKEVHKKFLSDLDFEELLVILKNKKKKKFVIKN
jgi:hypothetical protein